MLAILLASLAGVASAAFGPSLLYDTLSTQTLSLNGYTIQPYLSVMNGNVSYGQFNTYVAQNGVYTYQQYTGGSSAGCPAPSSMNLFIDCGSVTRLGPVAQPSPCMYQAVLTLPQACGISFEVGNEFASPSPLPRNATAAAAATSSSSDGLIAMVLGALGVSGVGIVIAIQVFNSMKNKGGLRSLWKANAGKIDQVLAKVPVSDSVKKSMKNIVDKNIDQLDSALDEKLKGAREKIAKLENPSDDIEVKVDERPPSPVAKKTQKFSEIRRTSVPELDTPPPAPVAKSPPPAPAPAPAPEPAQPETAKLEVSLADLAEIKNLLQRRNKQFAVAE